MVLLTTRPSTRSRTASDAMSALSSSVRSGAICAAHRPGLRFRARFVVSVWARVMLEVGLGLGPGCGCSLQTRLASEWNAGLPPVCYFSTEHRSDDAYLIRPCTSADGLKTRSSTCHERAQRGERPPHVNSKPVIVSRKSQLLCC